MNRFPLLFAVISAILLSIIIPLVNANEPTLEENDDFDLFVGIKEQLSEKVSNSNGKAVIETKLLGIFKDDQISNLPTLFDNISHVEKYLFSNFCPLMSHMEKMPDGSQIKNGKNKLLLHFLIEEMCKSNDKTIDPEFQEAALNEFFSDKELAGKIRQLSDQLKNILMKKIVVVGNVVNKKSVDTDETNNNNLLQQQHAVIDQLRKIQQHVDNVFGKMSAKLGGIHLLPSSKNENKISVWIREVLATGSDVLWPNVLYGRLKELWLLTTNQRKEVELLKRGEDKGGVNKTAALKNSIWPSSSARVIAAVHRRRRRRSGFRLPLPSQAVPSGNNDGGAGMNTSTLIIVVLLLFLALNMQQVLLALQFIFPLVRQEPQLLIFLLGGLVTMGFHLIAFLDRHHIATLN